MKKAARVSRQGRIAVSLPRFGQDLAQIGVPTGHEGLQMSQPRRFSTVADGPPDHDQGRKMLAPPHVALTHWWAGAIFRPVSHALVEHHRAMKSGRGGG